MDVFYDVAPFSTVDIDRRFRGAFASIIRKMRLFSLMVKASCII
jgi:hypothetical protein